MKFIRFLFYSTGGFFLFCRNMLGQSIVDRCAVVVRSLWSRDVVMGRCEVVVESL